MAAVTSATQNNQARAADPVNVVTGAFLHSEKDVEIPSQRLSIVLARHYNSQLHESVSDSRLQPFGPGWTYSFGMRLESLPDGTVRYIDDQGAQILFILDPEVGRFAAPPGSLGLRLTRRAGDGFELRQVGGLTGEFDKAGRIVGLRQPGPRRDWRIVYDYDAVGRLITVTGAGSRRIELLYEKGSNRICAASDHAGRGWHYGYNEHGELSEVVDPAGRVRRYEYDGDEWQVAVERRTAGRAAFRAMHRVWSMADRTDKAGAVAIATNWYTSERRVYLQSDALGRETRFEYNPFTRLTGVTDPGGRTTIYGFDDCGSTTKVRRPSGASTEYVFDDRRNLLAEIDPLGHATTYVEFRHPEALHAQAAFGRRAIGNRSGYLNFKGSDLLLGYDVDGNRPQVRTALGLTTRFENYTPFGKPQRIVRPDGSCVDFEYDERSGLMRRRTESLAFGRPEVLKQLDEWEYDDWGNCQRHRKWAESQDGTRVTPIRIEAFEYDANTQELVSSKRWLSESQAHEADFVSETRYRWDQLGRVVEASSFRQSHPGSVPECASRRFGYDVLDRRVWELHPDGSATCVNYDVEGRVVESFSVSEADVDRLPHVTARKRNVSRWEYDAAGREIKFIDSLSRVTLREWDDGDRCIAIVDSSGRTVYEYDDDGYVTRTRDSEGHEVRIRYSATGVAISRADSLGGGIHSEHDAIGRTIREGLGDGDPAGTRYLYDDTARSKQVIFPDDTCETAFYDELGNVVRRERGRTGERPSRVESYAYDGLGRMLCASMGSAELLLAQFRYRYSNGAHHITSIDALGHECVSLYDTEGRLVSTRDAEGRTTQHAYDLMGRLIRRWSDDGSVDALYTYGDGGVLTGASEGESIYRWEYDHAGRVLRHSQEAAGETKVVAYAYDPAGRVMEKTIDDHWWVRYSYGRSHLPSAVTFPHDTVQMHYDTAGRPTLEKWSTGESTSYQYSPEGSLLSMRHLDASEQVIWEQSFERDGRGRPLVERRCNRGAELERLYSYDELDQLTRVHERSAHGASEVSHRYVYDERGNRTVVYRQDRLERTYAYDLANRLLHVTSGTSDTVYQFDRSGLLIASGERRFEYDASHRLRSVVAGDGARSVIAYSATGDLALTRDGQGVLERSFYDRHQEVIADTRLGRVHSFWNGWPDRPVAGANGNAETFRIYTDATGSVISCGPDGEVFDYGPFGELLQDNERLRFGFESKRYVAAVGSYFNRQRFYDPHSGRFQQPDPLGLVDGPNVYRYARNNPTTYGDPTGLEPKQHSQGRITDLLLGLSYIRFPGQVSGRSYVVPPGMFEYRPHIVHYDADWNRLGRSDIVGPGWFETRPHVEHRDVNLDIVSRTYIQGPGLFESKPHAEHYDANWNRTGRSYVEGPGWFETHPHVAHYDANWNLQATTYTEQPGLLGSLIGEPVHLRHYAANGHGSRTDIGAKGWLDSRSYFRHSAT